MPPDEPDAPEMPTAPGDSQREMYESARALLSEMEAAVDSVAVSTTDPKLRGWLGSIGDSIQRVRYDLDPEDFPEGGAGDGDD